MPARLCVFLGSIAVAAFWLAGSLRAEPGDEPFKLADTQLEPVKWGEVAGWAGDDHLAAFAAYQASCQIFRNIKQPRDDRPIFNALWEICWLRDPFEALAIQIQGSARVILEDGTPLRINYDSHNGYPYTAVGRVLIERNLVPREEMSMQRIRDWMAANPDEAPKVRATNRSYIFFRITGLPIESAKPTTPFRRLMIAQDTGSAIVGPARADLYWGAGDDAARIAGRIRHAGRFVMLLPGELDMIEAGKHMPLPVAKPNIPEVEVKQEPSKSKHAAGKGENETRARKLRRQVGPVRWRPGS